MSGSSNSAEARLVLFSSFGASLVIPVFSIFLPLLAVRIGATPFEVGLVGGATWFTYWFMPLLMGQFSDTVKGRRFMVLAAVSVLLLDALAYSMATSPVALVAVRMSEGVAWAMFWPAIQAKMSRLMSADPGRTFTLLNLSWAAGTLAGPTLGTEGALFLSLPQTFLLAAMILAAVVAINVPFALRPLARSGDSPLASPLAAIPVELRAIFGSGDPRRQHQVVLSVAAGILTSGATYTVLTFFGPFAQALGYSVATIGEVFTAGYLARVVVYVLAASSRLRQALFRDETRNRVMIVSSLVACASPLLLLAGDWTGLFFLAVVLAAIGANLGGVMVQVIIIGATSEERKGLAAGLSESTAGIGASIGPVLGGVLAERSLGDAFIVPPLMFALFAVALLASRSWRRRRTSA